MEVPIYTDENAITSQEAVDLPSANHEVDARSLPNINIGSGHLGLDEGGPPFPALGPHQVDHGSWTV